MGKQVKESISRKATGWDLQESLVLKGAFCGFHRTTAIECAKEPVVMASPADKEMREMMMRLGAEDPI